jgi:hypothetical protein
MKSAVKRYIHKDPRRNKFLLLRFFALYLPVTCYVFHERWSSHILFSWWMILGR